MAKKFNLLTTVQSNEVSLCTKFNSGANKQTEFEIVKNEEGAIDRNMKPVIQELVKFIDFYESECEAVEEVTALDSFKEFLEYWMEYDINNTYYSLLSEALQSAMCDIKYADISKEEKVNRYRELFNMFIAEYQTLPITKTKEGKFEVSLVSNSLIKEQETIPQNETEHTTKEKISKMDEQKNMFEQALDLLKSAFNFEKTEAPAEEQQEVQEEPKEEVQDAQEQPAEEVQEEPKEEVVAEESKEEANVEPPVVEEEAKEEVQEESKEEVQEEPKEEPKEEVKEEEIAKTSEPTELEVALEKAQKLESELEELKKSNEAKTIEIEKMSFVQKAKDEFSMLVGTPEEIGEKLYEIAKSNLGEESKTFILDQLKKVSKENESLTEEMGSITKNAEGQTEEEEIYAKAQEIAKAKNISVNQALRQIK